MKTINNKINYKKINLDSVDKIPLINICNIGLTLINLYYF